MMCRWSCRCTSFPRTGSNPRPRRRPPRKKRTGNLRPGGSLRAFPPTIAEGRPRGGAGPTLRMADEKSTAPKRPAAAAGRGMPHSVEAEEYLLSCCLIDGADVMARCLAARICPEAFFVPAHAIVFERLLDLYNRQAPIDVAVLGEELKAAKQLDSIGGYAF